MAGAAVVPASARILDDGTRSQSLESLLKPPFKQPSPPITGAVNAPSGVAPDLFARATASLHQHRGRIAKRDRIAIADFSRASSHPRFQLVNLEDGSVRELLVAHGSGSDPDHSGFLQRFSNRPDSNATSQGAFVTAQYYTGAHGSSQRLIGLDPTNDHAFDRAIVLHGAWYANADMIEKHGKLGRSQGCFAVGETKLAELFSVLGEGRMIYSDKV